MSPQSETASDFQGKMSPASRAEVSEPMELASEQRIKDLETRLAGQARARSELVHLVSHELRTPITVISGFARLIQNENHGVLNVEQHRFAQEILKACQRLDDFVGDLLEASPQAETPFTIEPVTGDLHAGLTAQLESLAPLLDERGIQVETRFDAVEATFSYDARRIEQVTTNLMTNAIRYGRSAGQVRVTTDSGPSGEIEISIEDDGPGIPLPDRERIFQPYVRGEFAEGNTGLGIGLAISRRIVLAHGGRIWVEEGELGGARFVFSLSRTRCVSGED